MVDPHEDQIELVESQYEDWRRRFESERKRLERLFDGRDLASSVHRIEHVGSTAVPDLAAKDIVDVDVVVDDGVVRTVSEAIESELGGTRVENTAGWHPVFRRADGQRFNDHVFGRSDPGWRISVATVAALRDRPDLRTEYERLKRREARVTDDLETYSRAKSASVSELLDHATQLDLGFDVPSLDGTD